MTHASSSDKAAQPIILVINSGSSTIKYQLLDLSSDTVLLKGLIEGLGQQQACHQYQWLDSSAKQQHNEMVLIKPDHQQGFVAIVNVFSETQCTQPTAIGHRVVHGGEQFSKPTLIDSTVLTAIEQLSNLAPLHNPSNVKGIRTCIDLFPNTPQYAVFDTAFHQTMPDYAYRYAIPNAWYQQQGIRRYGFHGTSHQYVAQKAAEYLNKPLSELNLISLHLGNGASAAAIQQGQCIDTSMGFTPLEGLIMGSRCGDIDPAISLYMQQEKHLSPAEVDNALNHHSGLTALTGTQDMRTILKAYDAGEPESKLAVNMVCYRIKKYIGAYLAVLGKVDAIIFTGGIGENAAIIRKLSCDKMDTLGIAIETELNVKANDCDVFSINSTQSNVSVLVIKTNEERQIAQQIATQTADLL